MRIYFAAPLHDQSDRDRNAELVSLIRAEGHTVFLPQENGVWEEMVEEKMKTEMVTKEVATDLVRRMLFEENEEACRQCQAVVAHFGERRPSEGAIWEMGHASGQNKPVFLLSLHHWPFNLMPEFGSIICTSIPELLSQLHKEDERARNTLRGEFK